jgi:hypothetical protein
MKAYLLAVLVSLAMACSQEQASLPPFVDIQATTATIPTPTPDVEATLVARVAATIVAISSLTSVPADTPKATPTPTSALDVTKGLIAFRSDRDGNSGHTSRFEADECIQSLVSRRC